MSPAENYSTMSPAGQYSTISPAGQYSAMSPAGQYSALSPAGQYSAMSPAVQYSAMSPAGQYSTISPAGQYSTISPAGQYSTILPDGQYSTILPDGQYSTILPDGQYSAISPAGQYSTISSAGQYSTILPAGQYSTILPAGQYSAILPDGQYSAISPAGQYSTMTPAGQRAEKQENMVFKVSKGGVRSGNTLRRLRCRTARRYSRQAFIIGRSSLAPKEVHTFLESSTNDDSVISSLDSTDVILSLNKRKRWNLPATVSHMIKSGNFNNGKIFVSLLERHKLKRKANCVSFVCNQGRIRHVTPRKKRYFSFNLEKSSADQSNREMKRQKALTAFKVPDVKLTWNKTSGVMKTVEVFTMLRGVISDNSKNEVVPKPEIRLEVFYPCPSSCSLAYNPKYTNVNTENIQEGEDTAVKPSVKLPGAKRRNRNKLSAKDYNKLAEDMTECYIDEIDEDDDDYLNEKCCTAANDNSSSNVDTEEDQEKTDTDDKDNRIQSSTYVLANLLAEANKAKNLCEQNNKPRRRKNTSKKSFKVNANYFESEGKLHILYMESSKSPKQPPPTLNKEIQNEKSLHSARVILSTTESNPDTLRTKFNHLYAESESEPRRFVINVTDDVQNLLSTPCSREENPSFISYLVFVHDGFYDDDLDAFKVIFNSNVCTETLDICKNIPFERSSIEEIMNRIVSALLDMKQENLLPDISGTSFNNMFKPTLNLVHNVLDISVEAFRTHDEITRVARTDKMQENIGNQIGFSKVLTNIDSSMFCDICYENIDDTQVGAAAGTMLSRCGHRFCDKCWKSHLRSKIKDGSVKMICPGYDCDINIGPVTLLSLLHVSEVSQIFQRMCEEEVESSPNSKWCPNPGCDRVIRLDGEQLTSGMSLDVKCACGQEFCFSCLSQPHWPATCDQAAFYADTLLTITLPKETLNERQTQTSSDNPVSAKQIKKVPKKLIVEGRLCPKCKKFIEKNGGCNLVHCKCGFAFCWHCLKKFDGHYECKPNPLYVFENTRRVMIRHLVMPNIKVGSRPLTQASIESKKLSKHQKVTMSQKALQQRLESKETRHNNEFMEFAKKIASVAQRDLQFKRELMSLLRVKIDNIDDNSLICTSIINLVRNYLQSCHEIKLALHRVVEFTFVLLQDIADSVEKRRTLRLANDLIGYCSFIKSILELGQNQDMKTAVKRLSDIRMWARRAILALVYSVNKIRS